MSTSEVKGQLDHSVINITESADNSSVGRNENGSARQNYCRIDKEVAKYASDTAVLIPPEKSTQLRKMIDKRILVVMVITYFLQVMDKGAMNFASIMGIIEDTHLPDQGYAWLTTCIFITILIVEFPQNWIIPRVPIAKYLSFSIIAWSTVLAFTALCSNFTSLLIVRTLLGLFESVCQPAFLFLSAMWYRREEQAVRVTAWYSMNAAGQIVGGLLSYCFSLIDRGPLKSWQWLFLAYSMVSVFWGVFVGWYMPDSPMRAKCWSEEDKHLMVERVRDNQTGIQNRKFKMDHVVEAFKDPQVYGYGLVQLLITIPANGLQAFQAIIIKSLGFTTLQTQLLSSVTGFWGLLVMFSAVWIGKKTQNTLLAMLACIIPAFVGTVVFMTVTPDTRARQAGLLFCYYIGTTSTGAQPLALTLISRNVGGITKKSVAIAFNFVLWCAGNSIGPQLFLKWNGPRYFIAFATHLGCYTVLVFVIIGLRFHLKHQNHKKNRMAAEGSAEADPSNTTRSFEDLTDRQNLSFRYVI